MTGTDSGSKPPHSGSTAAYCSELQRWMWQYYRGYGGSSWHGWLSFSTACSLLRPPALTPAAAASSSTSILGFPSNFSPPPGGFHPPQSGAAEPGAQQQQHGGHNDAPPPAGREYTIPSPFLRVLAETVDFLILFCIRATVVLWVMHLNGIRDVPKFITDLDIDEGPSIEDLPKMMVLALHYRLLVCVYESVCIWAAGGATPGKFLLGLQVVKCTTCSAVRGDRVLVVPGTEVSLTASTVRAMNKNFSMAFYFPIFITLLFFQHNRTVYDIMAGTIVVQRPRAR